MAEGIENLPVNPQPAILVGTANKQVIVRVEGKGSFLNSTGLKEFAKEMMNRGFREFTIDLRNCPFMDSTFMGTLAGISLRLRELGQGRLHVVNLNTRNSDLLSNLGLDRLFSIDAAGPPAGEAVRALDGEIPDKAVQKRTMLEAHEAAVEANPENAAKFKDVLDYLRQDLHLAR